MKHMTTPTVTELVDALKTAFGERKTHVPFWRSKLAIGIVAGLVSSAATVSAHFLKERELVQRDKEIVLKKMEQENKIRMEYTDLSFKSLSLPDRRAFLRMVLRTSSDSKFADWAKQEIKLLEDLEKSRRSESQELDRTMRRQKEEKRTLERSIKKSAKPTAEMGEELLEIEQALRATEFRKSFALTQLGEAPAPSPAASYPSWTGQALAPRFYGTYAFDIEARLPTDADRETRQKDVALSERIAKKESEVVALRAKYGEGHAEVVKAERDLFTIEADRSQLRRRAALGSKTIGRLTP